MPVYKLNKTLSAINTHTKDVDDRYWKTHVYESAVPIGTVLWDLKKAFVNSGSTSQFNQNYFIISPSATVQLSKPLSKTKNGIIFNFKYMSLSSQANLSPNIVSVKLPKKSSGQINLGAFKPDNTLWLISPTTVYANIIDDTHLYFSVMLYGSSSEVHSYTTSLGEDSHSLAWYFLLDSITAY